MAPVESEAHRYTSGQLVDVEFEHRCVTNQPGGRVPAAGIGPGGRGPHRQSCGPPGQPTRSVSLPVDVSRAKRPPATGEEP